MQLLGGTANQNGLTPLLDDLRRSLKAQGTTELFGALSYINASGVRDLLAVAPDQLKITAVGGGGPFQTSRQAADLLLARARTDLLLHHATAFFHPKVFVLYRDGGPRTLYVGSSNLTSGGLKNNVETNLRLSLVSEDAAPVRIEVIRLRRSLCAKPAAIRVRGSNVDRLTTEGHLYDEAVYPRAGQQILTAFTPDQAFGTPAPSAPLAFVMTLGPNDVSGKHLDGYFLVPVRARDQEPMFWGWPQLFAGHPHPSRSIQIRTEVSGASPRTSDGRIYLVPGKTEFRVVSEPVHTLGVAAVGSVIVASWQSANILRIEVIDPSSPGFAQFRARCATTAQGGMKQYGYL